MRRGEVRRYGFKAPDKERPVLILSRDSALEFLNEATVAPITSTVRDIPSEVALDQGDGMTRSCAVNLDHIQTVAKNKLGPVITRLSALRMREVDEALMFALGVKSK